MKLLCTFNMSFPAPFQGLTHIWYTIMGKKHLESGGNRLGPIGDSNMYLEFSMRKSSSFIQEESTSVSPKFEGQGVILKL